MNPLKFAALRVVNRARVGEFKNSKGMPAHSMPDGSDWTVAQWVQAWIGEIGEFCEVRHEFEAGRLDNETYRVKASKELPDSLIYQDLLSMRALDTTKPAADLDAAQTLMYAMAKIGTYANARKKYDRGDINPSELKEITAREINLAIDALVNLVTGEKIGTNAITGYAHKHGLDMGKMVTDKFNEVSIRIGNPLRINPANGAPSKQIDNGTWTPFVPQ